MLLFYNIIFINTYYDNFIKGGNNMVLESSNIIKGNVDSDILNGTNIDDTIEGYAGNDTLTGNEGDDSLNGGYGNDLYIFNQGDGQDIIDDYHINGNYNAGNDTLKFGAGISQNDINFSGNESDIIIDFIASSDKITLKDQININNRIEIFEFADGSTLSYSDVESKLSTVGTSADETISGSYFSESIYGGDGNDTITTESGNDTVYGDGGNDSIQGSSSNDKLNGNAGNDTIEAFAGEDTLRGNEGNDSLNGGYGNDLYVFNQDDGQDIIHDFHVNGNYYAGNDTLEFGAGIDKEDLSYSGNEADIIVSFANSTDKITLKDHININNRIETLKFADGSTLSYSQVEGKLSTVGTSADELLSGSFFAESIYGGLGNDTITTASGNDTVYGDAGNDSISGSSNNDNLNGNTGADTIEAFAGNDTIAGNEGNDSLNGGYDNDLYIFNQGDGQDIIHDFHVNGNYNAGIDKLEFGAGIDKEDLSYSGSDADIIINFANSTDKITLKDQININNRIETLKFADGSTLSYSDVESKLSTVGTSSDDSLSGSFFAESIYGGLGNDTIITESGNDTVYGDAGNDSIMGSSDSDKINGNLGDDTIEAFAGNDTIAGNEGNDSVNGGFGNDLYLFNQGDGQDIIHDYHVNGNYNAGNDTLKFGTGITQSSLRYSGNNSDIIIDFIGSTDKITLKDHININNRIETFEFADGSTLNYSQIASKLSTIGTSSDESISGSFFAESIYGGFGNDTITTGSGNDTVFGEVGNDSIQGSFSNDKLNGNAGDDTIEAYGGIDTLSGNTGNDNLNGGAGNDTYLFNQGDGQDVIHDFYSDSDYNAGNDTLIFGAGIIQDDLIYTGSDFNIIIDFKNSTDRITLIDQGSSNNRIENFKFSDGSTLSYSEIESNLVITGTSADESISGSYLAESIYGGLGNDSIATVGGDDTVYGGAGDDYINGSINNYNETLYGNAGNDQIYGMSGSDMLQGNEGSDGLYGGSGNDTYVFNKGDGQDIIYDYHTNGSYDAGNDILRFGSSISEADTVFTNFSGDLVVTFLNSPNDKITVIEHYSNDLNKIETIEFALANEIDGSSNNDTLIGTAEDDLIKGFGGADILVGNNGYDKLFGGLGDDILLGDQGIDTLTGGAGNDTYVINDPNDIINEDSSAGNDTIYTSLSSYTLNANIENLTLIGYEYDSNLQDFVELGKGNDGIGNSLDNYITGNDLNNYLTGKQGKDSLEGGAGNDVYKFNYNDGVDFIKDTSGTDKIYFESSSIKNTAVFYTDASSLYIDYGTSEGTDKITVEGKNSIEKIELSSGEYLDNADIEQLIQDITTYATDNSVSVSSFDDVRNNQNLMDIVTTAWHS